ncbi:MAG: hypothetical protein H7Y59_00570 [Anaerolineales bacterium]|nr:hypothetical protein [Anaerolineales bacterium]
MYDFAGYDAARIQFIRFVNFVSIGIIAILLMNFLKKRVKNGSLAFFAILFFLSQTTFQSLMGYSLQLISSSQPAMWLSLLAFYLYFFVFDRIHLSKYIQVGIIFIVLMLAMQSTQTYAFFALIPLSYLALTDWSSRKSKVIKFLIISIATFILSTLIYKIGLDFKSAQGLEGYPRGEQSIKYIFSHPLDVILLAINPLAYWSIFKMWTFPFPLQNTPPLSNLMERVASLLIMMTWLGLIFGSLWVEIKNTVEDERSEIFFKWFSVACCFGLSAAFIVADSPTVIIDHRPHLLLVFSGLVIFIGLYALEILASQFISLRSLGFNVFIGFLVVMTAFGAQSAVLRNIVNINMKQLDFIRTELLAKNPSSYDTVIVVLPIERQDCITEPCNPSFGAYISKNWHLAWPAAYRYALSTLGINPKEKNIVFVNKFTDIVSQEDAVIIDWNVYSLTQQMYSEHFK